MIFFFDFLVVEKIGWKNPLFCTSTFCLISQFSQEEMSSKVKKRKAIDYYGISSVASHGGTQNLAGKGHLKQKKSRRENDKTSLLPVN